MNPLAGGRGATAISIDAIASTCRWHRALFLLPVRGGLQYNVVVVNIIFWSAAYLLCLSPRSLDLLTLAQAPNARNGTAKCE